MKIRLPVGHLESGDEVFMRSFATGYNLPEGAIMVELGSFKGRSACCWIQGLKQIKGKLITIDTHKDCTDTCGFTGVEYVQNINNNNLFGDIIHIIGDFNEVRKFFSCEVDSIFIDGLHEYEDVSNDFEQWSNLIKKGGFLIFHDYANDFPGVQKLVNEIKDYAEWEFIEHVARLAVFKRL